MKPIKKALILGDAMIPSSLFAPAFEQYLSKYVESVESGEWESDWGNLQYRRLEVEKKGPEIEKVPDLVYQVIDTEILMGLFVPISSSVIKSLPKLRIVGVSRAGLENVNLEEATANNIMVFNVQGRNAEAVSDFVIGLMLSEIRNIGRAFVSIKNGEWRKQFFNSSKIPEMKNKNVGIIGFGHIGRLVAKKLSGFNVKIYVYDPFVTSSDVAEYGGILVDKDELFKISDFVTIHARLTEKTRHLVGRRELGLMKPTAFLFNTARAGLIDQSALEEALSEGKILGAGLDVFPTEPIPSGSKILELDNVTLTTHIAGTTSDALTNSPFLLMEDIAKLLDEQKPHFLVNPEVLDSEICREWLGNIKNFMLKG